MEERERDGIGFEIPPELHNEFKKKVEENGRKKSWVLRKLVEFYLRDDAEYILLGVKKVNDGHQ